MKYVCATCNKVFLHTAKYIDTKPTTKEHYILPDLVVESAVCPHCLSKEYSEYVEEESLVVSIKKVPHEEADKLIAEGYQPKEYYAKDVVMVKKAGSTGNPEYCTKENVCELEMRDCGKCVFNKFCKDFRKVPQETTL